jgi:hypothetical protein
MGKKRKAVTAVRGFFLEEERKNGALIIDELKDITLGELAEGYVDNSENIEGGVYGWNGNLEIRPKFQRSFVVDGNVEWQSALIHSVLNKRPIGTMYFGLADNGKMYINIDGQQRLMTLLSFINGDLTLKMTDVDGRIKNVNIDSEEMPDQWRRRIKQYTPKIMVCKGSEEALLSWFITINQPISELTSQELRNAAYHGSFVECAKRIFSVTKATAEFTEENGDIMCCDSIYCYKKYSSGLEPERQDVLEMALDWISLRDYGKEIPKSARIECYMNTHRHDDNANDLLFFYKSVIDWVNDIFFHNYTPNSYQSLASQDWARMYIEYHNYTEGFTEDKKIHITERCKFYIGMGSDLYSKSDGIYEWVLRGEKKEEEYMIHVRAFKPEDRRRMYNAQGGYDPISGKKCDITEMHGHHIKPWRLGGSTDYFNLVMLSEETHNNLDILGLSPEDILMKRDELIKKNQASKL